MAKFCAECDPKRERGCVRVLVDAPDGVRVQRSLSRIGAEKATLSDLTEIFERVQRDFGMFQGYESEADVVIDNTVKKSAKELASCALSAVAELNRGAKKAVVRTAISRAKGATEAFARLELCGGINALLDSSASGKVIAAAEGYGPIAQAVEAVLRCTDGPEAPNPHLYQNFGEFLSNAIDISIIDAYLENIEKSKGTDGEEQEEERQ